MGRLTQWLVIEADVAVRMSRPTQNSLVAKKVGEIALGFHATPEYIARKGLPTTFDELVLPSAVGNNSSSLTTGNGQRTNVAVQQICSGDTSEHMMVGTTDPVAYRLGIDAVDHPGPANPARIARSVCGERYMPGVDPATATGNLAGSFGGAVAASFTPTGMVTVEPPLPGYTLAPRR